MARNRRLSAVISGVLVATSLMWTAGSATPVAVAAPTVLPSAPVSPIETFRGQLELSIDGTGTVGPSSSVQVRKPNATATVKAAFVAVASTGFKNYVPLDGDVRLDGQDVLWDPDRYMQGGFGTNNVWADVTDLVDAKIDAAAPGIVNLTVAEPNSVNIDGVILAVVFDDPTQLRDSTIVLAYGAQTVTGDRIEIIRTEASTVEAELSLGISFGFQPTNGNQATEVDVNGQRLTSSAGGQDDGVRFNGVLTDGALITVGGIGDSPSNPPLRFLPGTSSTCPRCDDELYDLTPFLDADGSGSLSLTTRNPSNDDNVFFAALKVTGGDAEWLSDDDAVILDGTYGNQPGGGYVEDPVHTGSGNLWLQAGDITSGATGPMRLFERSYNSRDRRVGVLGRGWSTVLESQLRFRDQDIEFQAADGRTSIFVDDGQSGYLRPVGLFADLTETTGGYELAFSDGQLYAFDDDGQLVAITSWTGEQVTFSRAPDGLVDALTWSTGETLAFTYSTDRQLVGVAAGDGRTVGYGYTNRNLTSVIAIDGTIESYAWTADDYLESMTAPDGVVAAFNTFDVDGRVTAQTTPTGSSTFDYADSTRTTTVTNDETGDSITYLHDEALRLIGALDDEGGTVGIALNTDGLRTSTTDRLGYEPVVTYDVMGNITSTDDPIRGVTTYVYDTQNRVVTTTEPTGAVTTMTYEGDERLPASVTDGLGNTTSFDIVGGLIAEATDPDGITTTYTYDQGRRMIAKTNGLGETTTYEYDSAGRQIATTSPLGFETRRTLDDAGRTLTETAPDGGVTTFVYDSFGRIVSITDPVGATSTNSYDSTTGFLISQSDPVGRVTTYGYDEVGRLTETTSNDNSSYTADYGLLGRVTTSDDELDRAQTYSYDADGNPTETTAPDGGITASEYDTAGRVTATVDSLGRRTDHTYDEFGRLALITQPDTTVITYAYDILGRRTAIVAPDGGTSTTTFTPGGRSSTVTDPEGGIRTNTYDLAGRIATITDPNGNVTTHTYDADGRRTASTSPEGLVTTWEYDPNDRVTKLIDPAGIEITRTYTLIGQVATEQLSGEGTRSFTYNLDGTLDTVTDALGNTTTMGYDNIGRLNTRTDATGAAETWTHNAAGEITRYTDRLGRDTDLTYDANGRLATTTDPTGRVATFAYNTAGELLSRTYGDGDTVSFTYDTNGRRATMADATGTTTYTYDANGRPTVVDAPTGILAYTYDLAGRRTGLTYPDGTTASYAYDPAGRLLTVTHPDHGTTNYTHSPDGRVVRAERPDGTTRVYDYTDGRLVRQDDNGTITDLTYDNAGRVSTLTGAQDHTYTYDLAGQLLQAEQGPDTYAYTYGSRGEITSISDPDRTRTFTHNANTEIVDITDDQGNTEAVTYDNAGRLTDHLDPNGDTTNYTYDSQGRLAETTIVNTGEPDQPEADPCADLTPTITGTNGDDQIQGTSKADIIFGLGGNDTITGRSGDDIICGGDGDDIIDGGTQDDTIYGGAGNDTIDGGTGSDTIYGGTGNDTLDGRNQNDIIHGGDGDDIIEGGNQNDTLDGGNGNDTVDGGKQTDTCDDAEIITGCETVTNDGEPDPPTTGPTTTTIARTYNGDSTLIQLDTTTDIATEQIDLLWDDTIEVPQVVDWDGGTLDYGNLIYGYSREAAPDTNTVFAGTALGDLVPDAAPFGSGGDATIGFGYRGELDIYGDIYLRNRTLISDLGVFNDTDPLEGIAGTSTFSTPFHYADNDPVNQLDPLGLRPDDADFGTYKLIQPIPSCSPIREGGMCLDEFAVLGFDYSLDSSDNREWMAIVNSQIALCFSNTNQSDQLNIRFHSQPELRDICLWWTGQQGEVYREVTCSREVFGKCFSTRLGWEGVQENAVEILLNSVTLGGYNAFRCGRLTSESYFTGDLETRVEGTTACASTVFMAAGAGSFKFNVKGLLRPPKTASPLVPGGGLAGHELAGGHTIARHLGLDDAALIARTTANPNITGASTWSTRAIAEQSIDDLLAAESQQITSWLTGNSYKLVLDGSAGGQTIGRYVAQGSTRVGNVGNLRVVLVRDANTGIGFRIQTAFPTP